MKLELTHISPYLQYGLKGKYNLGGVISLTSKTQDEVRDKELTTHSCTFFLQYCKPILRPLSDITKELFINGEFYFVPSIILANEYLEICHWGENEVGLGIFDEEGEIVNLCFLDNVIVSECPYSIYKNLCEWHFDIFGLIDAGLAIDINTLK